MKDKFLFYIIYEKFFSFKIKTFIIKKLKGEIYMKEYWRDIDGYKGLYQVSNTGKVRSLDRPVKARGGSLRIFPGKELTLTQNVNGYLTVSLYKEGEQKTFLVHRLVASAFVSNDNPKVKKDINHIDFDKTNNNSGNLEWCTKQYNIEYGGIRKPGPIPKKVRCINNGMIFDSINDAAQYMGLKAPSPIYRCCIGQAKTSGVINGKPGRWEYID